MTRLATTFAWASLSTGLVACEANAQRSSPISAEVSVGVAPFLFGSLPKLGLRGRVWARDHIELLLGGDVEHILTKGVSHCEAVEGKGGCSDPERAHVVGMIAQVEARKALSSDAVIGSGVGVGFYPSAREAHLMAGIDLATRLDRRLWLTAGVRAIGLQQLPSSLIMVSVGLRMH